MFLLFPSCSSFSSFFFYFKFFLPCRLSSLLPSFSLCPSFLLLHHLLLCFLLLYSSSFPLFLIFLSFCSFMYTLPFLFLLKSSFSISLHIMYHPFLLSPLSPLHLSSLLFSSPHLPFSILLHHFSLIFFFPLLFLILSLFNMRSSSFLLSNISTSHPSLSLSPLLPPSLSPSLSPLSLSLSLSLSLPLPLSPLSPPLPPPSLSLSLSPYPPILLSPPSPAFLLSLSFTSPLFHVPLMSFMLLFPRILLLL